MNDNKLQEWAVIRLATIGKKREASRLLFATVTVLNQGRPVPAAIDKLDYLDIKKSKETIYFRKVIQSKEDAEKWYRSLGSNNNLTPVPTRTTDRNKKYDGIPFDVSKLQDDRPWPKLGLPLQQDLFTHNKNYFTNPAPFIGNIPARLHRRIGSKEGFDGFIQDKKAVTFIKRRLHIDLEQYHEYLGGAVYLSPDPVIKQIDNFMVPAKGEHGERIIYRFIPYPGQTLQKLKLTEFSVENELLTNFDTYRILDNNILTIDKGICGGLYGFIINHDDYGVLAYQPPSGFLRQINTEISIQSDKNLIVQVPTGSAKKAPQIEYQTPPPLGLVSQSILGDAYSSDVDSRVKHASYQRKIMAEAKYYGQHWFPENSRKDTIEFIHDLIRPAQSRVIIADPFFEALQIFQFLYVIHAPNISIKIYTTKQAWETGQKDKNDDPIKKFQDALDKLYKHRRLSPEVRVLSLNKLHDRFLIVDDNVWFVGNSFNSIGDKASMIVRLPNPYEVIERLDEITKDSQSLDEYKANLDKERDRSKKSINTASCGWNTIITKAILFFKIMWDDRKGVK